MKYLYTFTFIYLTLFNQISYAININGNISNDCYYQGTVINLNKITTSDIDIKGEGIELLINIKDNLSSSSQCLVPLNENIRLIVIENNDIEDGGDGEFLSAKIMNKEIKIGSNVKFNANKFILRKPAKGEWAKHGEIKKATGFIFLQWVK